MKRLGLDYDSLKKINPRLVMLSIGIRPVRAPVEGACYDSIIQACSG